MGVPGRFLSALATVLATGAAKLMSAIYLLSPLKGQNHFSGTLAFTADLTDELLPGLACTSGFPLFQNDVSVWMFTCVYLVRGCGRTKQLIHNIPPIGTQVLGCGRRQTLGGASEPASARTFPLLEAQQPAAWRTSCVPVIMLVFYKRMERVSAAG